MTEEQIINTNQQGFGNTFTERALDYAHGCASPSHGEGWESFTMHLEGNMEYMESLLLEALDHVEQYDDGMAEWLEKTRMLLGRNE